MTSKNSKIINDIINEYSDSEKEYLLLPSQRHQKTDKENNLIKAFDSESEEKFKEIKEIFSKEIGLFGFEKNINKIIFTERLHYRHADEKYKYAHSSAVMWENVRLEFYYGNTFSDSTFLGITYGLHILPFKIADKWHILIRNAEQDNVKNHRSKTGGMIASNHVCS
ncbi:TPA: hypothetical protein HA293_00005 [Candidatus Woesearchaeota archaeon]|nr:hypothetical protein [Candidatus Woesearchaeota archaeon]